MDRLIWGILYIVILILFVFFFDTFWDFLSRQHDLLSQAISRRWSVVRSKFLTYRFRQLVDQLLEIEEMSFMGLKTGTPELTRYKFYTALIRRVWSLGQSYGVPIRKILREIRLGLLEDGKFERKVQKQLLGGIVQFIVLALITWGFICITHLLVEFQSSIWILLVIAGLQLLGLGLFGFAFNKCKRLMFSPFSEYFQALYSFKSLSSVGVSLKLILENSNLSNLLANAKTDMFQIVNQRLEKLLVRLQKKGVVVKGELDEISGELWYLLEQKFSSFSKRVMILKFMIITLFFLSSYFLFLFSLFELFLIE